MSKFLVATLFSPSTGSVIYLSNPPQTIVNLKASWECIEECTDIGDQGLATSYLTCAI